MYCKYPRSMQQLCAWKNKYVFCLKLIDYVLIML